MALGNAPIQDRGDGRPIQVVWAQWFTSIRRALIGWTKTYTGSVVINFGSIAAQASAVNTTLTHEDAQVGDVFIVSASVATAGIIYEAYCAAAGVITIRASNFSAGAVDPASTTFRVIGFKQ